MMIRWKSISIATLLSAIPVYLLANAAYVNYHTELAGKVVSTQLAQHTKEVEGRIDQTQKTAEELQSSIEEVKKQVSSLQVSAAIAAVAALQAELDRHERDPEDSVSWRREHTRLQRQVEQAKEYRQCLIDGRRNCDLLRGW